MKKEFPFISWHASGRVDFTVGTGASPAERALAWGTSFGAALVFVYAFFTDLLPWTWVQYLAATVIAFDVAGGVVANALNSCKRFYHTAPTEKDSRKSRFLRNKSYFSALHIHPLVVGLLFGEVGIVWGALWYGALQAASWTVLRTPLYLQRPVSMLLVAAALVGSLYLLPAPLEWQWLIPFLFLKIVSGHNVREEPYRPATEIV